MEAERARLTDSVNTLTAANKCDYLRHMHVIVFHCVVHRRLRDEIDAYNASNGQGSGAVLATVRLRRCEHRIINNCYCAHS